MSKDRSSSRGTAHATPAQESAEQAALKQLFADRDAVYERNAAELEETIDRERRARERHREMQKNADAARRGSQEG